MNPDQIKIGDKFDCYFDLFNKTMVCEIIDIIEQGHQTLYRFKNEYTTYSTFYPDIFKPLLIDKLNYLINESK